MFEYGYILSAKFFQYTYVSNFSIFKILDVECRDESDPKECNEGKRRGRCFTDEEFNQLCLMTCGGCGKLLGQPMHVYR